MPIRFWPRSRTCIAFLFNGLSLNFSLQIFNRDEPDREKLVYVTVKATDKGRPALEDVCTLRVRIKDINDNAPVFDRSIYNVPIAQVRELNKLIRKNNPVVPRLGCYLEKRFCRLFSESSTVVMQLSFCPA